METIINSNKSVWTSSTLVVDVNSNRRYWAFCNDSDNIIYLSISWNAEVWKWIRLNANGWSFEITKDNLIRSKITAIATGTWSNLSFVTIE